MWILLNEKPVRSFDIVDISKIHECTWENLVPAAQKCVNPDDYPNFCFIVNKNVRSKRYKTLEEAEEARNNLLLAINTIEANLPRINI